MGAEVFEGFEVGKISGFNTNKKSLFLACEGFQGLVGDFRRSFGWGIGAVGEIKVAS